jgi:hypothetical protein
MSQIELPLPSTGWRPDLSGSAAYIIVVRGPNDPPEAPRGARAAPGRYLGSRALEKGPWQPWTGPLLRALADGQPRTFNRISVELTGRTADVTFGGPIEEALWRLVEIEAVAFTLRAPVLFMAMMPLGAGAEKEGSNG